MFRLLIAAITLVAAGYLFAKPARAAEPFRLQQDDTGATVKIGDQLFTRYVIKSGTKPILWPILGPTGKEMTRGYPMRDAGPEEKADHVHHRSLWFDHGNVNGISFWDEQGRCGTIEHRQFLTLEGGPQGVIRTSNDWMGPNGDKICQDIRTLTFGADEQRRWIDFDVTVTATADKVVFGDTKEGSFGIRVAGSLRVDRKDGGQIVTSEEQTDQQAWGKRAAWVDYSGMVAGQRLGIAILNHPQSFRYPTYWHVRTYGLFAANPFGWHDFLGSDQHNGSLTLGAGESFSLFYRVIFHQGDEKQAGIATAFAEYAQLPKSGPQPTAK